MCLNESCPLKESCYRSTAIANEYRQSYCAFKHNDGKCDNFISNNKFEINEIDKGAK